MQVYTNESNPATLKLLVGANFAKAAVTLKVVNLNDKALPEPRHLPCLVVTEEVALFSPNSALEYLQPPDGATRERTAEWLEWEATVLAPLLAQALGGGSRAQNLKDSVSECLGKLDKAVAAGKYLCGDKLDTADVAIWASLFPLFVDNAAQNEYLSSFKNVTAWLGKLGDIPKFKNAVKKFEIGPTASASYQALLAGARYPSSTATAVITNPRDKKDSVSTTTSNISPQHLAEAVTNEELENAERAWSVDHTKVLQLRKEDSVILPKKGEKNILITSALPYVNNVPHLGNIIGCVLSADVFARFCRICNYNTLYIGGTDEYGTATETKALEERMSCQEICDKYYAIHRDIYEWFNISFARFGRSSCPEQTEICQEMFLRLNDNGFVFTDVVEQLHCEQCNKFLADRFVEGGCPHPGCTYEDARGDQCDGCGKLVNAIELKNPKCKICSNTPKLKTSTQFFMDLPKLEPLLLHWMKTSSPGWSHNAQIICKTWLRDGLKPRCITRDLKWGVPVPLKDYRDKVFYVWFDAPIGYMSMTKAYTAGWEQWWRPNPEAPVTLYQFMAKDNVPFHSVMFPGTLLGCNRNYVTVSHIMATEYLNYEDGKFSKSRGVGVFGNDARDTGIPSDVWRFYLLYVRPETQDSSFSWADLATKNNSELLNNLGNFINRALVFAKNNFGGTVPEMYPTKDDFTLLALCTRELKGYVSCLDKAKLRDGIRHILSISRHGNQYMQSNQPWVLLKGSAEEKKRAGTVIGISCNIACLLATLLHPYMPVTSDVLKKQLNSKDIALNSTNPEIAQLLPPGHRLGEPSPLFAKLEPSVVEELKKKFAGKQQNGGSGDVVKNGPKMAAAKPQTNGISVETDAEVLEAQVAKQADKVRTLKSGGKEKSVWQPEVAILLGLKKQLEAALKSVKSEAKQPSQPQPTAAAVDPNDVKMLEDAVSRQGLVVRKLKEAKSDKAIWQPEVTKLLDLKSRLAALTGVAPAALSAKSSKKGKK